MNGYPRFGWVDINRFLQGDECLGGYLRKNSILNYEKRNGADYVQVTIKTLHKVCINAAWSRSLNPAHPPYECNPYSDVDKLIMRLFNEKWVINWIKSGTIFYLEKDPFKIVCRGSCVELHYEGDNPSAVINSQDIYWCDEQNNYEPIIPASKGCNVNFSRGTKIFNLLNKPKGTAILCIKSGFQEFYFEICDFT